MITNWKVVAYFKVLSQRIAEDKWEHSARTLGLHVQNRIRDLLIRSRVLTTCPIYT